LREEYSGSLENSLTISIIDHKFTQHDVKTLGPDIYSEIEVTYLADLIKKKIERNKTLPVHELHAIHRKSLRTLDFLMQDLLLSKLFGALRQHYEASEEDASMINTTLKLLLRCKRLSDAKAEI
jgi:hypothetical protein